MNAEQVKILITMLLIGGVYTAFFGLSPFRVVAFFAIGGYYLLRAQRDEQGDVNEAELTDP